MDRENEKKKIKNILVRTCKQCRISLEDHMQDNYAEALLNAGYINGNDFVKWLEEVVEFVDYRTKDGHMSLFIGDRYYTLIGALRKYEKEVNNEPKL